MRDPGRVKREVLKILGRTDRPYKYKILQVAIAACRISFEREERLNIILYF